MKASADPLAAAARAGRSTIVERNSRAARAAGEPAPASTPPREAGRQQALARDLRPGVVPRRPPAREVRGVGLAFGDSRRPCRAGCRCCPPPRTAPRAARPGAAPRAGARTGARGRRSSGRWRSRGRRRRAPRPRARAGRIDPQVRLGPQALAGRLDHRRGVVDPDHPPSRQALDERLGDPPGPAAGVEDGLLARSAGAGRAPPARAAPWARRCGRSWCRPTRVLAYARTLSHTARRRARAISFESCPPCQAIGERGGGPAASTTRLGPRDRARVASPTASGWPGSASSRLATTSVGTGDPLQLRHGLEGTRAGHDFEGVGHRLWMLVGGQALAQDRLHGLRQRRGTASRS